MPVPIETPTARVERKYREWYRSVNALATASMTEVEEFTRTLSFHMNGTFLRQLVAEEEATRFELEDSWDELFRRHYGTIRLLKDRQGLKDLNKRRVQEKCDAVYGRREAEKNAAECSIEAADVARGREAFKAERERAQREHKEREQQIHQREVARIALLQGLAFYEKNEYETRLDISCEQFQVWKDLLHLEKEAVENLDAEMNARWLESEEGRRIRSAEQARLAEEKKAAAKKAADFKREQNRLANKCTHSRNGTSVFVGATPRKMCLICKIKFDAATGIYSAMK